MEYLSKGLEDTGKIAGELAEQIVLQQAQNKATVIALEGELGAGKTTFVKAFAKALGIKDRITSPTFVILRRFVLLDSPFNNLYHIDAYRLESGAELEVLGIDEIVSNPENIAMIEWAERVADVLPEKLVKIKFEHMSENERKISIK